MGRSICILVALSFGFGLSASSAAQRTTMTEDEILELHNATRIVIDGKKNPDAVPFATRMKLFFYRYKRFGSGYQAELKHYLSAEDDRILSEYADRHADEVTKDRELFSEAYSRIASVAHRFDGLQLARSIEAETQKSKARAEARYRHVLGKLSREGHRLVMDFAQDRVRPVVVIQNPVMVATVSPEWFKERVVADSNALLPSEQAATSLPSTAVTPDVPVTETQEPSVKISSP